MSQICVVHSSLLSMWEKKHSCLDGFPLKFEGWTKRPSLKTIPFPPKAIKTCIQLYKEFPEPQAKYAVRCSYYQSGCRGLGKKGPRRKCGWFQKKKRWKKSPIWFPFWCGKADVTACFETIFPTKTPSKLNKIDSVGFIVPCSFVFSRHCLCLCHGNRGVICLYRPFYNNVPFLTKQQRKYQVKPLPPSLMIRSIWSPCFRWIARMSPCSSVYNFWWRFPLSQSAYILF